MSPVLVWVCFSFFLANVLVDDDADGKTGDTGGLGAEVLSGVCGVSETGSGVAGAGSEVVSFVGEAGVGKDSAALGDFLFFPGHFCPTFISFGFIISFGLVWTRIFPLSLPGWLPTDGSGCGGCGVLLVFSRAEFGDVTELLAAPAAWSPAIHHYHHLPIPANNGFRDGLEILPC